MDKLKEQLKGQIIEALNLEGITPEDIENDKPLFGGNLGLDSIDALELIVLLEQHYKIKVTNPEEGRRIFNTIDSIAEFITEKTK